MNKDISFAFIIPVYNESERITRSLIQLKEYFNKFVYNYVITIVDDGSTDSSYKTILTFKETNSDLNINLIKLDKNSGKGYAIKTGILNSDTSDYFFYMDSDLSTPLFEIDNFINYLDKHNDTDIIIGSRSLPESNVEIKQFILRESMGRIFNKFVKLFVIKDFIDTQCGFKLFTNAAAHKIFPKLFINRFAFDVEVLFLAKKYGFKTVDIPITWRNDKESKVNVISDSLNMFIDIMKIRFYDLTGKYDK